MPHGCNFVMRTRGFAINQSLTPGRDQERRLTAVHVIDLNQFNPNFFTRLRERVSTARDKGLYVSVMLFQGFSVEQKGTDGVDPKKGNPWDGHPYNRKNNINRINGDQNGNGEGEEIHTLSNPAITKLQEQYVKKMIDTLNDLENIIWEISNESHGNSTEWQYHFHPLH